MNGKIRWIMAVFFTTAALFAACGGGGGGSGGNTHTVGGTVSGLTGTVVLQNNLADDLTISSNGTFTFAAAIADGAAYSVTVLTQPAGQTCTESSNTGTIAGANVTNVSVVCADITYTVGGTITGLGAGKTVVLQNNNSNNLTRTTNGAFTFTTALADGSGYAVTVLTQPAGQACLVTKGSGTIAAADVPNVSVACANSGSLDLSFGTDGIVTTATGSGATAHAVAIQTDGKIVVAGVSTGATQDFTLARYNPDGSPDNSFGTGGKVITVVGIGVGSAYAVAIQPDGKIVAAGTAATSDLRDFALVRYCANGHLDDGTIAASGGCGGSGFGTGGKVTTTIGSSSYDDANAVAIQTDGRIVAAGWSYGGTYTFALVRYNADGSLDTSFDGDGKLTTAVGTYSICRGIAIQTDGKIVAAGYAAIGAFDFALVRYCSNGHLDDGTAVASGGCGGSGFDTDGKVTTAIGSGDDTAQSLAIQTDGKIVAAGRSVNGANNEFAVVRYNADGSLDTSFDTDGRITTAVGVSGGEAFGLAIQTDGKIMAAGHSFNASGLNDLTLVRYTANGSLDTSFDGDGKAAIAVGPSDSAANAVAIQADGKIVAAGYAYVSSPDFDDFAVVRIWP